MITLLQVKVEENLWITISIDNVHFAALFKQYLLDIILWGVNLLATTIANEGVTHDLNGVILLEVRSFCFYCHAFPSGGFFQHRIVSNDDIIFLIVHAIDLVAALCGENDMTDVSWLWFVVLSRSELSGNCLQQEKIHRPTDVTIFIDDSFPCWQTVRVAVVHHVVIQGVFLPIDEFFLDLSTDYSIS